MDSGFRLYHPLKLSGFMVDEEQMNGSVEGILYERGTLGFGVKYLYSPYIGVSIDYLYRGIKDSFINK